MQNSIVSQQTGSATREAARQVRARCPACRVVALTVHGDEAARQQALQAGVDAFIVKGAALETLMRAVSGR